MLWWNGAQAHAGCTVSRPDSQHPNRSRNAAGESGKVAASRRWHLHWAHERGQCQTAEFIWGKVYQTKGAACLFLNNRVPKWKGQESLCLLKCYNPLECARYHPRERKASGQDLQLELSVYQAGAGVGSSKESSPEGIKSEIERWVKVVSNGHGKRPPETAQQHPSMGMKSRPWISGRVVKNSRAIKDSC